jgi:hypothetical protein
LPESRVTACDAGFEQGPTPRLDDISASRE